MPDTTQRLAAVGAELERACGLLTSPAPANLDACARILEDASIALAAIPPHDAAQSPDVARELAHSVRKATALLRHAADFHESWRRVLGAMCAGYQPDGAAAPASPRTSLCLEG